VLRLVPRDNEAQHVASWRISPSTDGRMRPGEDAYGNLVQRFEAEGPLEEMTITVDGVVNTVDTAGILRGLHEPVPPDVFLRGTGLTTADEALIAFAMEQARGAKGQLETLHNLMDALHETLAPGDMAAESAKAAPESRPAPDVFKAGSGLPRDMAHVFIAAARHLEIPTRIVTGYHAPVDGSGHTHMLHSWAEAHAEGYGWIGFDVALGLCPTIAHVRLACGLDYTDVTPIRGARKGGGKEAMNVVVDISGQQ
jgi:transglutaminase-like putative cysteine protease